MNPRTFYLLEFILDMEAIKAEWHESKHQSLPFEHLRPGLALQEQSKDI